MRHKKYPSLPVAIAAGVLFAAQAGVGQGTVWAQSSPATPAGLVLENPAPSVHLQFDGEGRAELAFRGTTAFGVRLESASSDVTVSLKCTGDPIVMKPGEWSKASGACQTLFSMDRRLATSPRTVVLAVSSDPYPSEAGEALPRLASKRDVTINISASSQTAPATQDSVLIRFSAPLAGLLVVVVAVLSYSVYRWRKRNQLTEMASRPGPADAPTESVEAQLSAERQLSTTRTSALTIGNRAKLAPGLSTTATDQINALMARVNELEKRMEDGQKFLHKQAETELREAVNQMGRQTALLSQEANRLGARAEEAEDALRRVQSTVESLRALPPGAISQLLASVPSAALTLPDSTGSATTLAARFNETLRGCVRKTPEIRTQLVPMKETLAHLQPALDGFVEASHQAGNKSLIARFTDAQFELRELLRELDTAVAGIDSDRVFLYFRVDLSTLCGTHQDLTSELANSLRKQIARLEDPLAYFGMRFEITVGQVLQEVIDCCDSLLDPGRQVESVQRQIGALVAAAKAVLIAPRPGTPFIDSEHLVFGITPCVKPEDRPDHISALRVRGLQRHNQVLKKASVIIYC
ncbi:MAG: hypothetical protein QM757_26055 [Paludibaculum sp.]